MMARLLSIVKVALAVVLTTTVCERSTATEKPNFIVINFDDFGHGAIGPCGPKQNRASQLVRVAVEGREPTGFCAGMGIMVGEVTPTSALAQVRLTQTDQLVRGDVPGISGVVKFVLESEGGKSNSHLVAAKADRDFIARAAFVDLTPATRYTVRTQIGPNSKQLCPGPTAKFRTNPGAASSAPVRFVVVTGMNYAKFHGDDRIDREIHLRDNNTELPRHYSGPDKHLGYPALATILKLKPNFFVGTGDNVYYDTPKEPRAQTVLEMRRKWHEQFVQPRFRNLFAAVPTYWMIDDHDYRIDDGDNTGDHLPSPETGRRMMLEQLPVAPAAAVDAKTYRTHRVNRDLQIWFPENRMYRSPNDTPDGPEKTIWGAEQKAWLKRTLVASDATFKLLISPNPMIGPDDKRKTDNHTNIGGFRHERDEFFAWLKKTGIAEKNFYVVCGDRHWQYHSIHPTGLEEFSCGALVDANSRPGRKPGDPLGTDPAGLVKQVYSQETPSGGFLLIEVTPAGDGGDTTRATLTFKFHDERGKVLYEHRKADRG
jgi:alkaline phosphatase/alkaline phosphatase D